MGSVIELCCGLEVPSVSRQQQPKQANIHKKQQSPTHNTSQQQQTFLEQAQQIEYKNSSKKQQEEEEQFYDIDEFVQERQHSNLQPPKITSNTFQIVGLLGEGAFGSVFCVKFKDQTKSQQMLAMKRMPRQITSSQKIKTSLKLQKHILATSNSTFITSLKYSFTDRRFLYLVMDLASGGDASRFTQKGTIRTQFNSLGHTAIQFILACTIQGIQYLHQHQIIYRDLKPQNILIFSNGYAKLSDFGLARTMHDQNAKFKTQTGTALYNAPEMVLQQGYGRFIDLWALGVLAYELKSGETPFKLEDVVNKLRFKRIVVQEQKNRRWRGIDLGAALTDLVGQLLRFKPEERLGANNFEEIQQHPYFAGFDWRALSAGTLVSPLQQIVSQNPIEIKTVAAANYVHNEINSDEELESSDWSFDYEKRVGSP